MENLRFRTIGAVGLLAAAAAFAGGALAQNQEVSLKASWDKGLQFKSDDGTVSAKIGGRVHNDWMFASEDDALGTALYGPGPGVIDTTDAVGFRRARIEASGNVGKVMYAAEYEFATGAVGFRNVYMGMMFPTVGMVKVGHMKEPFSLDQLTSSNNISFMERSLANAFVPAFNTGIMASNVALDDRMTWALGVFRETGGTGGAAGDGEYSITARVAGTPWQGGDPTQNQLLHVGVGYSMRKPAGNTVTYTTGPEIGLAPVYGGSGALATDEIQLFGLEAAFVWNEFSVQGEFVQTDVSALVAGGAEPTFSAWYAMVSYFVTGESRMYDAKNGTFGRVEPKNNFDGENNWGALELLVRMSSMDMNDDVVVGPELDTITIGVNWYLNANSRVMLNYVLADLDGVGDGDYLGVRFQVNF